MCRVHERPGTRRTPCARPDTEGADRVSKFFKRLLFVLVIGFCLFYVVNQPEGAAAAVRTAFLAVGRAFGSIITFFTSLAT
jgi:small-conductance mechanosensitive channel